MAALFASHNNPTSQDASGQASMTCANKFGQPVTVDGDKKHVNIFQVDPERASTDFRHKLAVGCMPCI